jgi:hypothetical protein
VNLKYIIKMASNCYAKSGDGGAFSEMNTTQEGGSTQEVELSEIKTKQSKKGKRYQGL